MLRRGATAQLRDDELRADQEVISMPGYLVTFTIQDAADESEALTICSERLAGNRDFDVEVLSGED